MPEFNGVIGRTSAESTPEWETLPTAPPGAPNIVYLVFDDTGFSDFGCYGSEVDTPNLNALASRGLRYTNFHTTALCSPTRAALLTGRNHHSVGMGQLSNYDYGFPGLRGRISKTAGTVAEMLKPHGYNTYALGKWHLTPMAHTGPAGPYEQWPTQRGFDLFYGFLDGMTNQWDPMLTVDNHPIERPDRPDYHLTEDLVDEAINMIENQTSVAPDKPFFMYLAFGATHSPHHVPRHYIDKYMDVFEKGWDQTRLDRLARQLAGGIVPEGTDLPPRNPGVKAWDDLSEPERRLALRLQAAFAGMLEHTDEHIGRFLAALERLGRLDNTLIVVISDNGASQEGSPVGTLNQLRYFEGAPVEVADAIEHLDEIGETQWLNNYPLGWAMAGNTPCKWYKQNTHGGGVRDPLIVSWPKGIDEAAWGGIRRQFHHVSDVTPTIIELLGIEPPTSVNGVAQQPIEGTSFAYSFAAPDEPTHKHTQYFEMIGHRGIVHDGWKAVALHRQRTSFDDDRWELYHLDTDFSECHDRSADEPKRLREMIERWWSEAGRYQVLPIEDRFGGTHRRAMPVRGRWVMFPGSRHVPVEAAPPLAGRSWSATAEFRRAPDGCGVLVAQGGVWGGWTMFVDHDGSAVVDHHFPGEHTVVRSPAGAVPEDAPTVVRFELLVTGKVEGLGRLYIDDQLVTEQSIERRHRSNMAFDRMSIGRNDGTSVSALYAAPFPFAGEIRSVTIELLDTRRPPSTTAERAAMGAQ